jgi:hypothetical protein
MKIRRLCMIGALIPGRRLKAVSVMAYCGQGEDTE